MGQNKKHWRKGLSSDFKKIKCEFQGIIKLTKQIATNEKIILWEYL